MPTSSEALSLLRKQYDHMDLNHVTSAVDAAEEVFITNKLMFSPPDNDVFVIGSNHTPQPDDIKRKSESRLLESSVNSVLKQKRGRVARGLNSGGDAGCTKGGYYIQSKTVPADTTYSCQYDSRTINTIYSRNTVPRLPGIMPTRRIFSARLPKEQQAVDIQKAADILTREATGYNFSYDSDDLHIDDMAKTNVYKDKEREEINRGESIPGEENEKLWEDALDEKEGKPIDKEKFVTKEISDDVYAGIDAYAEEDILPTHWQDRIPSSFYSKSRPSLLVLSQRKLHMAGLGGALGVRGRAVPCRKGDLINLTKKRVVPHKRVDEIIIRQIEIENLKKSLSLSKESLEPNEFGAVQSKRHIKSSYSGDLKTGLPNSGNKLTKGYGKINMDENQEIVTPSADLLPQHEMNSLSSEHSLIANLNSPGNQGNDTGYFIPRSEHKTLIHESDIPGVDLQYNLDSRLSGCGSPVCDQGKSDASASDSTCSNDIMTESSPPWQPCKSPPLLSIIQEESLDDQSSKADHNKTLEKITDCTEKGTRRSQSGVMSNGSKASFNKSDHDQFIEEASTLTNRANELLGTKSREVTAEAKARIKKDEILEAEKHTLSKKPSDEVNMASDYDVIGLGKDNDDDEDDDTDSGSEKDGEAPSVNPSELPLLNMMQPQKSVGRGYRSASQAQRAQLAAFKRKLRSDEAFLKKMSPYLLRGHREPPAPQPARLCLARGPPDMTHARLMALLEEQAGQGVKVESIRFDPVYMKPHTPAETEACRWVFELSKDSNPDWILFKGLVVDGQHIEVRHLDDQLRDEWLQYLKYNAFCKDVKFRRSQVSLQAHLTHSSHAATQSSASKRRRKLKVG